MYVYACTDVTQKNDDSHQGAYTRMPMQHAPLHLALFEMTLK